MHLLCIFDQILDFILIGGTIIELISIVSNNQIYYVVIIFHKVITMTNIMQLFHFIGDQNNSLVTTVISTFKHQHSGQLEYIICIVPDSVL